MFSLEVDGLEGWIPAPLDQQEGGGWFRRSARRGEAALRADLARRMSDYPREAARLVASLCWSSAQASRDRGEPPLLAMWARYEDHRQTVPTAIATLRMVPVEPDATPLSFANGLTVGLTLHQPFELTTLATKSGEAHRLVVIGTEDDKQDQFARHDIVFWIRPGDGEGMVLATTTLDPAMGASMGADLAQLATGVQWG